MQIFGFEIADYSPEINLQDMACNLLGDVMTGISSAVSMINPELRHFLNLDSYL